MTQPQNINTDYKGTFKTVLTQYVLYRFQNNSVHGYYLGTELHFHEHWFLAMTLQFSTVRICCTCTPRSVCLTFLTEWVQFSVIMASTADALTAAISKPAVFGSSHGWTWTDTIFFWNTRVIKSNFTLMPVAGRSWNEQKNIINGDVPNPDY